MEVLQLLLFVALAAFIGGIVVGGRSSRKEKENLRAELSALRSENWRLSEKLEQVDLEAKKNSERLEIEIKYERLRAEKRAEFLAEYDGKPVRFLFHIPENISVADGGFPVVRGWKREDYWVYKTFKGDCFHRESCSAANYSGKPIPIRIWDATDTLLPCLLCKPKSADFTWYDQMRRVEKRARGYGLLMEIENGIVHLIDPKESKAAMKAPPNREAMESTQKRDFLESTSVPKYLLKDAIPASYRETE